MRFKLLNFARKPFLMVLKIIYTPPCSGKLYTHTPLILFILHYKYPNNLQYIHQIFQEIFHEMNGFGKLRDISKLSTFCICA